MVVEDEALIAELIGDVLVEKGFSVHLVSNAGDALRHLVSGAQVDVLFTDINLPGTMDGSALAQRARELRPGLPIVFSSGRWHILDELRAMPASVCLPKPCSPTQICAAVDSLIARLH
jgi:CheY-like chemotaxis protein